MRSELALERSDREATEETLLKLLEDTVARVGDAMEEDRPRLKR